MENFKPVCDEELMNVNGGFLLEWLVAGTVCFGAGVLYGIICHFIPDGADK